MPWYGWIRKNNICTGIFKVLGSWPILVLWLLIVNVNVYHIATCFNALWNILKRGSRINTDRFPKRSPKAQASNIRGSGGMLPWQFFEVLSPLSFPDRHIGRFHSTRMKPCKSANCFILDFNLKSFCGEQEEPAILISRLLLCMHCMYEASICLDFQ